VQAVEADELLTVFEQGGIYSIHRASKG